jgi:glutathione S-transferase
VFSTAVLEPSLYLDDPQEAAAASGRGWGMKTAVMASLEQALAPPGPWLLGEMFSAADVMLGAILSVALFNKRLEGPPAYLTDYDARLQARPAYQRAAQATWSGASGT